MSTPRPPAPSRHVLVEGPALWEKLLAVVGVIVLPILNLSALIVLIVLISR